MYLKSFTAFKKCALFTAGENEKSMTVTATILSILSFLIVTSYSEEEFYSWNFDNQSDWKIDNDGKGLEWVDDCLGNDLEGGPCVHIEGEAIISRVISTIGYHSIRIQIDIVESALDEDDWCYIGYKSSSIQWTDKNLVTRNDDIVLDTGFIVPNNDSYNNQSSFELRLGNSGCCATDNCYFDTLQVFGIAYTPSPTDTPTESPSEQPSTTPSNTPSESPSISPSATVKATSLSPSASPLTSSPTDIPSEMTTLTPTKMPTEMSTEMPQYSTFNPSKRPTHNPTLSPNDDLENEISEPTVAPSSNSEPNAIPASTNDANTGIETLLIIIAFVAGVVVTICIMIGLIVIRKRKNKNHGDIRDKTTEAMRVSSIASISSADSGDFNEGFAGSGNGATMHVQTTAMSINEENDSSDNEIMYEQNNVTTKGMEIDSNDAMSSDGVELMNMDMDNGNNGFYVRCLADYIASDEDQLNFEEGQMLYIMRVVDSGWWFGIDDMDNDGWIPSNYVERIEEIADDQRSALVDVHEDTYKMNLDKYLNYSLPAEIVPVLVTSMASDSEDELSEDSDKMTTNGMTTKGTDDKDSSDSENDKMYDRNNAIVTENGMEDVIDEDDEMYQVINTTK